MLDPTSFDPIFKIHYAPGNVENILFDDAPAFSLIKKEGRKTRAGGKLWYQPVQTGLPNQGSAVLATANAATDNETRSDAFEVPRAKHYRVAKIDNETIEASSQGDEDSFQSALDEIDRCIKAEANWANFRIYRSKGGAIGQIPTGASVATTSLFVVDQASIWAASKNDVLEISVTDGNSGAIRVGSVKVAGVVHAVAGGQASWTLTGVVTAGVAAAAALDFIFMKGDFGLCPAGFADYVPDTAAEAITTLYAFDRSADNRLGGIRVDGTGMSISDLLTDMVFAHISAAQMPGTRVLFAHPFTIGTLTKQQDVKTVYMAPAGFSGSDRNGAIMIKAYLINIAGVEVNIVMDRMCPVKRLYLINLKGWTMFHANTRFPAFLTERVSILKISETADAVECRVGGYLNNCTKTPHANVVGLVG